MTNEYRPIGCDQHSVLELLALRQARVEVCVTASDGTSFSQSGQVTDVLTRERAEYLILRETDGPTHSIRLDRIRAIQDRDGNTVWRQESVV